MKIEVNRIREETGFSRKLSSFCEELDLTLTVTERPGPHTPGRHDRWHAALYSADIKEGAGLGGISGNGATPRAATVDMCREMSGKLIVARAGGPNRVERLVGTIVCDLKAEDFYRACKATRKSE